MSFKSVLSKALAAAVLVGASLSALAAPTMAEVQSAVRAQNWTGAETMLKQVVQEKPNSAKAWYYLAQTEEKLGNPGEARSALAKAEKLEPTLSFASPGSVKAMEGRLAQTNAVATTAPRQTTTVTTTTTQRVPTRASSADSGMISAMAILGISLGALAVIGLIVWIWRRANAPAYVPHSGVSYGGGPSYVGGNGGGYGGAPMGGGTTIINNGGGGMGGSNLLGTVLLADALSHHHHDSYGGGYGGSSDSSSTTTTTTRETSYDSGASSSSSSSFDFGGGSSSWDSGSSSSSFDSGSSSSGSSDW